MNEIALMIRRGPICYEWKYRDPIMTEQIRWEATEVLSDTPRPEAQLLVGQLYRKRFGHSADLVVSWEWKPDAGRAAHACESLFLESVILVREFVGLIVVLTILLFIWIFVWKVIEGVPR